MTITHTPVDSGEVIDLRAPHGPHDPHAPVDGSTAAVVDDTAARARRRRLIVGAVMALIGLVVWDAVAGRVMHDQQQRHLAHEVTVASSTVGMGDALMVLQIPQIGFNQVVVQGAGSSQLRGGPGHLEDTALPGEAGNIVIVGRSTRSGAPFSHLKDVVKGSTITVKTRSGAVRSYEVDRVRRVGSDSRVPTATSTTERLTLVTAAGGIVPDGLRVVSAKLVGGTAPSVKVPAARAALAASHPGVDRRPANSAVGVVLLLAVLALMVTSIVVGGAELRRRYSALPAAGVLLPVVMLLAVVLTFCIDVVVPASF